MNNNKDMKHLLILFFSLYVISNCHAQCNVFDINKVSSEACVGIEKYSYNFKYRQEPFLYLAVDMRIRAVGAKVRLLNGENEFSPAAFEPHSTSVPINLSATTGLCSGITTLEANGEFEIIPLSHNWSLEVYLRTDDNQDVIWNTFSQSVNDPVFIKTIPCSQSNSIYIYINNDLNDVNGYDVELLSMDANKNWVVEKAISVNQGTLYNGSRFINASFGVEDSFTKEEVSIRIKEKTGSTWYMAACPVYIYHIHWCKPAI